MRMEYDEETGKVLYIGNYLNGKRNGKGEEYDHSNNIIFEGEYLNGKKTGKEKNTKKKKRLIN